MLEEFLSIKVYQALIERTRRLVSAAMSVKRIRMSKESESWYTQPVIPSIMQLPDEILLQVFSCFSPRELYCTISPVCRRWYALARDCTLWKELCFIGQSLPTDTVRKVLQHSPLLQRLEIVEREDAEAILRQVNTSNKHLRLLAIRRCRGSPYRELIPADVLISVVTHCSHLEDLTIKDTQFHSGKFYSILGSSLPKLRKVNLSYNTQFGSAALNSIAKSCKQLEELRCLQRRTTLMSKSVPRCNDDDIKELCTNTGNTLRVLKLTAISLTDRSIESIIHCPNLHTLHMRRAMNITNAGIAKLSQLNNISSLEISMAFQVKSKTWCDFFNESKLNNLKSLMLVLCVLVNDSVLECIGEKCKNLERIRLSGCIDVTEFGLSHIIRNCLKLRYLNVFLTQTRIVRSFPLIPLYLPSLETLVYTPAMFDDELEIMRELRQEMPSLAIEEVDI